MKVTPKPKIQKARRPLHINPDINIPSTVSVGNFARLLNVKLGKDLAFPVEGSADNLYFRSLATGDGESWDGGTIILRPRCVIPVWLAERGLTLVRISFDRRVRKSDCDGIRS